MRIEDKVIPARFLVTLGHLIGVIMIFKTKSDNVYAGLSSDPTVAEVATANTDVNAALAVAMVCFGLDFVSIFFGLSIFMMKVNALQTVAHFSGAVLIANFITEEWDYRSLWRVYNVHIVGLCNLPTALVEVAVLIAVFYLKSSLY
ncbi:unnamed protein product [Hapterophycus canaliculatus]